MISGVGTSEYSLTATFTGVDGTWESDYPAQHMADVEVTTCVARVTPDAGAASFTAVLPASVAVQFIGLADHTLAEATGVEVFGYSDATMLVQVFDTGVMAVPAPARNRAQNLPIALDAAVTIRAIRVELTDCGSDSIEIGGLCIGTWWRWPWITESMGAGVQVSGSDIALYGGGSIGASGGKLRTRSGSVSYLDLATASTTGLQFQKRHTLSRPFMFVENYEDPTTRGRECFLARNEALPAFEAILADKDNFSFRFVEAKR